MNTGKSGISFRERYSISVTNCNCDETRNFSHYEVTIIDSVTDIDDGGQISFCFDNKLLCERFIDIFAQSLGFWQIHETMSSNAIIRCDCYKPDFAGDRHTLCGKCLECCKCLSRCRCDQIARNNRHSDCGKCFQCCDCKGGGK